MKQIRVISTTPFAGREACFVLGFFALVTAYYRLALPFFVLLLYLLYLVWSYYWTLSSCRYLAVALEGGQEKIFVGESITWNLIIINKLWLFPLVRCGLNFSLPAQFNCCPSVPLEFAAAASDDNEFTSPDEILPTWKHGTLSYAWLPEKEEIKISLQMEALLRGVYYFPPLRSFVGDPSGLYHGLQELKQGQYVTVFPRLKNSMELMGALALTERERANNFGLEDPYEIQGVKDYQRTDSARSINWYATARTNSLKTNVYQRKDSQYCLVVLDLSVGYQPTYIPDRVRLEDPLLEEAISIAASLALYHLEEGVRTAFFTNAPLFKWDKKENPPRGSEGIYMQRQRRLTTLERPGTVKGNPVGSRRRNVRPCCKKSLSN